VVTSGTITPAATNVGTTIPIPGTTWQAGDFATAFILLDDSGAPGFGAILFASLTNLNPPSANNLLRIEWTLPAVNGDGQISYTVYRQA
jgi:hypothetical protein